MSSPENKILERLANGSLEVEHLLNLAIIGDAATADFLNELRRSGKWEKMNSLELNSVPYQDWALVIQEYLRGGFKALESLAMERYSFLVVALLEHLHTSESVVAMIEIFADVIDDVKKNQCLADDLVSSLNVILSFPPAIKVDDINADKLREFIHQYIEIVDEEAQYATGICALRGVGNESSVRLIKSKKPLSGSWQGTEKIVIKKIKDNLREGEYCPHNTLD